MTRFSTKTRDQHTYVVVANLTLISASMSPLHSPERQTISVSSLAMDIQRPTTCLSRRWKKTFGAQVCRQDTAASAPGRGRGGGRRAGNSGQKAFLDDACWSCDDEIVITTESRPPGPRVPEEVSGSQFKVGARAGKACHCRMENICIVDDCTQTLCCCIRRAVVLVAVEGCRRGRVLFGGLCSEWR